MTYAIKVAGGYLKLNFNAIDRQWSCSRPDMGMGARDVGPFDHVWQIARQYGKVHKDAEGAVITASKARAL